MKSVFSRFLKDEAGATSIEYSLIAALIGVVIITGVTKFGTNVSAKFSTIANSVT
jgi:pilus assembly protein Flp/PilA